jgi:hypothetical protein
MKAEYTLNLEKWRCGAGSMDIECYLGEGDTEMLNDCGYMCCLGQFALQTDISTSFVYRKVGPAGVAKTSHYRYDWNFVGVDYEASALAVECMKINDDVSTSVWEKLCKLAEALDNKGIRLMITGDLPL